MCVYVFELHILFIGVFVCLLCLYASIFLGVSAFSPLQSFLHLAPATYLLCLERCNDVEYDSSSSLNLDDIVLSKKILDLEKPKGPPYISVFSCDL